MCIYIFIYISPRELIAKLSQKSFWENSQFDFNRILTT